MTLVPSARLRSLREMALNVARRHLRDPHKAEDAAQNALISYWQAKAAGTLFRRTSVFIRMLGHRKAVDLIRRDRKYRPLNEGANDALADDRPTPREQALAKLIGEVTRAQMQALPAQERVVFEMIWFEQCSRAEVAERTGLPIGSVGRLYYFANVHLGFLEQPTSRRRRRS